MDYISTRDVNTRKTSAQAIAEGLSREGGLFVPERLPRLPEGWLRDLMGKTYVQRAAYIMKLFLEDFSSQELEEYCRLAYSSFDSEAVTPVKRLDDGTYILELWHGPTCAFKDVALQILPYLMTASLRKTGESRRVCILVATSGDTGKAALEGFRDVEGTKIMVFYPRDGVSQVQKLQMTSQEGSNVAVNAIYGNFDDAQRGVKTIFSDPAFRQEMGEKGWILSSANSINWGRLLPQVVYYFSAYADLVNNGAVKAGEKVNFCVPTGNFGDILAGYYARKMGLPVGRLICASNRNDVLTEFINTGVYDRNRPFYETTSPSMDILVSSNLERLLFDLAGDDVAVASFMARLNKTGRYAVPESVREGVQAVFSAGSLTDLETGRVIGDTFRDRGYLMDTHTAVAAGVLEKYRAQTGDRTLTVVLSTASPFKFTEAVLTALGEVPQDKGPQLIDRLTEVTGVEAPAPLAALKGKTPRFEGTLYKDELLRAVRDFLE